MQRYIKVKTDYKQSEGKAPSLDFISNSKWSIPLALSLLAFAIVWRLGGWLMPVSEDTSESAWIEQEDQISYEVALPEEVIASENAANETEEIEPHSELTQEYTIQPGGNLGAYFKKAGIDAIELPEVLKAKHAQYLKRIYPGQVLRLQSNALGKLNVLQLEVDPLTTLIISREENGNLLSKLEEKPVEKRVAFGGGKILDSFFVAGKNANLDDALILELANIFAYDIDFAQDIQPNDFFKVLFEEHFVNGVKVGNGPIVAAEFVNNGKQYQAIRYTDTNGNSSYFTPKGESLKKAFIRTPVQYTRISSHFNPHRRHPVLHKIRAHRGVDYAAPTGTPVKAVGNGKVVFVGKKGGYGNAIILQHGHKYTTLYGHLSRFAQQLKAGHTIKQGQVIGYVGSTGLASGPHLHYEFRINGVHHNPLTVPLPQAEGISSHRKPGFLAHAGELLGQMERHERVLVAAKDI